MSGNLLLANAKGITIRHFGELSIQCLIDNGVGTAATASAPSDTPVGTFQLWVAAGQADYVRLTSTAIDAELAKLAPNGNNLVNAMAVFKGVPGHSAKIVYVYGSGGAATRCRLYFAS
jgi:hypothetical protein